MKWWIGHQKEEKASNTRIQVQVLITSREGIGTLQSSVQEWLPVSLMLFENLITLVLSYFFKFSFLALLNVPFYQHIIKDDK